MDAVTSGRVKFTPERYAKSYLDWLAEKRDWCISRQLWWGHRIPVWSGWASEKETRFIEEDVPDWDDEWKQNVANGDVQFGISDSPNDRWFAWQRSVRTEDGRWFVQRCIAPGRADKERQAESEGLTQDPDVLDTWFSSALWPHSTFGWPEATPEVGYYYPTSVLVTSRDIITLWVARMVLTGLYNLGEVPFHHVYITPKILDGFGETMSKSKGNGVDPLDIIDIYGADALRFYVVSAAGETQDSRLPVANVCPHCGTLVPVKHEHMYLRTKKINCPSCKKAFRPGGPWPDEDKENPTAKQGSERFEQGRNFANKLWNASRFLLMNLEGYTPAAEDVSKLPVEDRWILSRLAATAKAITEHLEAFKFSDVARTLYDFTWSEFCDWYVEMSKGRLKDSASRATAQRVLAAVLDGIVRLAQPVMPFLAESIWEALGTAAPVRGLPKPETVEPLAARAKWPEYPAAWIDADVESRMGRMQELVRAVREIRNRYMVDPKTPVDISVRCSAAVAADLKALEAFIKPLATVGNCEIGPDVPKPAQKASFVHADFEAFVSLVGLIDPAAESARLTKQVAEKRKYLESIHKKLASPGFVDRAPAEVVQQQRDLIIETESQIKALEANLADLN